MASFKNGNVLFQDLLVLSRIYHICMPFSLAHAIIAYNRNSNDIPRLMVTKTKREKFSKF